jgi:hypothetical protein
VNHPLAPRPFALALLATVALALLHPRDALAVVYPCTAAGVSDGRGRSYLVALLPLDTAR